MSEPLADAPDTVSLVNRVVTEVREVQRTLADRGENAAAVAAVRQTCEVLQGVKLVATGAQAAWDDGFRAAAESTGVRAEPDTGREALRALAVAAARISRLTPADAECAGLLARLSVQLAEATEAAEDVAAGLDGDPGYARQALADRHRRRLWAVPAPG